MNAHNFPLTPIPLHRNAIEETCSICGVRSWRYKDGSRWVEREECTPLGGEGSYKIENRNNMSHGQLSISFSGGRTSAYMLHYLWFEWAERENWEMKVVFANTGLEHPDTLVFVNECSTRWGIPVTWVEARHRGNDGEPFSKKGWRVHHQIVDFSTAARANQDESGKWSWTPFEEMISLLGIPTTNFPFCSSQLKKLPMESYLSSVGWSNCSKAIGIRADEFDRMSENRKRDRLIYPLISAFATKETVNSWWARQDFNLVIPSDLGNCEACWKKDLARLCRIATSHNDRFDWWKYITATYGHFNPRNIDLKPPFNFYRGNLSPWDIEDAAIRLSQRQIKEKSLFEHLDGCSESCEAF